MSNDTGLTSRDDWLAIVRRNGRDEVETTHIHRAMERSGVESGLATISVAGLHRPADAPPLMMTVLDISAGGVMLRSFDPLECGAGVGLLLSLGDDEAWLQGFVMHCTPMLSGHKVGVQLCFDDAEACA